MISFHFNLEGSRRGVNWFNNKNFKIKIELNRKNLELKL